MINNSLIWVAVLVVGSYAVPNGYVLEVQHDCGAKTGSGDGENATVTIISDLFVEAHLKCQFNDTNAKIEFDMEKIDDTKTKSTRTIYYPNAAGATSPSTECFFFGGTNSNVYVVELELFWGFTEGTLMDNYETYTITCTLDGNAEKKTVAKAVDDDYIAVKGSLAGNLGTEYNISNGVELELINALDKPLEENVAMGAKVRLQMKISSAGLTPYECYAFNSDDSKTYRILNAGCGDGVIFPKSAGFETVGNLATSPMFKAFKLSEATGTNAAVSFKCNFASCGSACDGSSCKLKRTKRSADQIEPEAVLTSKPYRIERLNNRIEQSERALNELKVDSTMRISTIAVIGVAVVAFLSLMLSLYSCIGTERLRSRIRKNQSKNNLA